MEKPQRNKPCPCNSGRKYKKCCLPKQTPRKPDCGCCIELEPTQFEIDARQRILADTMRRAFEAKLTKLMSSVEFNGTAIYRIKDTPWPAHSISSRKP
jgi:hypothetical protein